jgi:hypothetical protein
MTSCTLFHDQMVIWLLELAGETTKLGCRQGQFSQLTESQRTRSILCCENLAAFLDSIDCLYNRLQCGQAHDGLLLGLGITCLQDRHESGHAPTCTLLDDQVS